MLTRWSPFDDFATIFNSLDNLVRHGGSEGEGPTLRLLGPSAGLGRGGFPSVESFRRGESLVLRAELPGVDPKNLDISVEDGTLTLRGEKNLDREEKEQDVFMREVYYGRFERAFTVPRHVKPDQIQARFENGVLEVTLPARALEDAGRKVPIQITEGKEAKVSRSA
jgi:HSP20 family protein